MTQVVVSADDPAMSHPTKPIGPFYSRARGASEAASSSGGRSSRTRRAGYRRVVPSPEPLEIVEEGVIRAPDRHRRAGHRRRAAAASRWSGTAAGPARRGGGHRQGPRVGAAGRRASGADYFIISTDADRVYVNYKKPDQRPLGPRDGGGDGRALPGRAVPARQHGAEDRVRAAVPRGTAGAR
ncbi:MAG: hypothetical protein MZV49_25785 [Rhodopseudomonas palustris]|nr:hypothetical protein [Rhodopseudomonas palustris]